MHTRERIEQFYKDVESLKLKFPVAVIARETGESKGNVSRYLRKSTEPSKSFLERFYKSFKIVQPPGCTNRDHDSNLNELREYMLGMWADILAGRMATLRSLERLEGKNKGELTADADILAVQIQDRLVRMRRGIEGIGDSLGS